MDFFNFLSLVGGLALFLYGMELMGDGLSRAAGGKLESILARLTDNTFKSVLLGIVVTGVIQSSSATTVMLVGLVNSGIIVLDQAIPVIMGANIGTTVTSWLLSLAGIESNNFFIKLLKPMSFSPVIAIIGVAILLFSKKEKKKNFASVMIGFAILMFGMDYMSSSLKPLAEMSEFRSLFIMFENPILGLIVGIILTSIIQSSSASVGILQALSLTGNVTFASAIPIIMGQNIGTCVTAILSSIGSGKNGKRTALVHLYFNLIGTIVFMLGFYLLNYIIGFSFMEDAITPLDIAICHSIFNVVSTSFLLPFSGVLKKLAFVSIPEKMDVHSEERHKIRENLKLLDDIFLDNPSFALSQSKSVANFMGIMAMKNLRRASKSLSDFSDELFEHISSVEDATDKYEDAISTYLIKLGANGNIGNEENRKISILFKSIGYFERIGDLSFNIAKAARDMHEEGLDISSVAKKEMDIYLGAIDEVSKYAMDSYINNDVELAKEVEPLEDVIDRLTEEMRSLHVKRLMNNLCNVEVGFLWSDIMSDYERISDYCSNIALLVISIKNGSLDVHEYINHIKKDDNSYFKERYDMYKAKYQL